MSSNQGNKMDRYEIFRIRQGMRPRSNDEAYFDCSGSPMIDGFDHKIRAYNKKGATGNQRFAFISLLFLYNSKAD
ncbi:unnamed protein product [Schistosoma intercalatum]|nr:unnamed protein product [Schistosoma intercalatum]